MEKAPPSTPVADNKTPFVLREEDIINLDFYNKFTQEESVSVTCAVCTEIVIDPFCCSVCLNSFCKACIDRWIKKNNGQEMCIYRCPNARITPNRLLRQFLRQLKFKCMNGCGGEIEYAKAEEHYLKLCPQIEKDSLKKKNEYLEKSLELLQKKVEEKEAQAKLEKEELMKMVKQIDEELRNTKDAKKKSEDSLKEEIKKLTDEGKKKDDEIKAGKDKIAKLEEDNNNLKAESEKLLQKFFNIQQQIQSFFGKQRELETELINDILFDGQGKDISESQMMNYFSQPIQNISVPPKGEMEEEEIMKKANNPAKKAKDDGAIDNSREVSFGQKIPKSAFLPPNSGNDGSNDKNAKEPNLLSQSCILNPGSMMKSDPLSQSVMMMPQMALPEQPPQSDKIIKFEVYENERWWVFLGWAKKLAGIEVPLWCRIDKPLVYCDTTMVQLPDNHYRWIGDWKLEKTEQTDKNGWQYANNFSAHFGKKNAAGKYVRRRKWIRYAKK